MSLFFFLFASRRCERAGCYLLLVNLHQFVSPFPQSEMAWWAILPPLFVDAQWNISVAAQVPEYTEKVKLSKSLILYLGFCFYGYFAAWKQRRKPAPCCQPAGDGPKPGDTHMLSHCLVLLLNSWQDFSQSFLRHLSGFPFGEEEMEDGSHGRGHRQWLRAGRSTRLPSPWAFCPSNAGKQVPGTASASVRVADPPSTVGENDGKHMMAGGFLQVCVFSEYITCFDDKCGERAVFFCVSWSRWSSINVVTLIVTWAKSVYSI